VYVATWFAGTHPTGHGRSAGDGLENAVISPATLSADGPLRGLRRNADGFAPGMRMNASTCSCATS